MLLPVLAFPVALALVFPFRYIGFVYELPKESAPSCRYVELTEQQEDAAFETLRSAFSLRSERLRDLRADLSLSTLPEEPPRPILTPAERPPLARPTACPYDPLVLPPSLAAEPLRDLPVEPEQTTKPAFSRDELLKLD